MEYLLKASAITFIFYICYKLFLQRETFFKQNRWFLLTGLATAFIIPLLVIPVYIIYNPIIWQEFSVFENVIFVKNTEATFNILDYFLIIYIIGVVAFSVRFLFQLVSLSRVLIKNDVERRNGYSFVKTTNNSLPFSFFKWIVYNPSQFKTTELDHIITHEKAHVNQYHSIDSLLVQISSIVLWFNPIIWLYSKDLKQNLEFIADKLTQNSIDCKKSYQYTLLKTSAPSHQLAITNNFYNSLIKKRIVMLHKSKSKKVNHLKYLLILPVLGWFIMSFNTEEIIINKTSLDDSEINNRIDYGDKLDIYIEKNITDDTLEKIKTDLEEKGYTLKISDIKRNTDNYITSINITISYKESHNTSFNSSSTSPIKTIKIVIDKKDHSITIGNSENHIFNLAPAIASAQLQTGENPLYIIDGKVITEKGFSLHKYDIESINVLKGKKAIEKYGDKGKDGVIEITNKSKSIDKNTIRIKTANGKTPLFIIDGKEITEKEMNAIDSEDIKKINVLKEESAIKKYGDKGKDGVIEITTK